MVCEGQFHYIETGPPTQTICFQMRTKFKWRISCDATCLKDCSFAEEDSRKGVFPKGIFALFYVCQ